MKFRLLLVLFVLSSKIILGSDAEETMKQGNQFYMNNNYEKAIEKYSELVKKGYSGKELFYNLGNAYFKTGRIGFSILNYEKALRLAPSDEDIIYNLKIANARTVDKIEIFPRLFLIQWWESLVNFYSVNGWTQIIYVLYLLIIALVGAFFLTRRHRVQKLSLAGLIPLIIVFALSVFILALKINFESTQQTGILVENTASVKLSPDRQSGDAFIIHEGIKVNVEDKVNGWLKIRLADGKVGWIENRELAKI